MWAQTVRNYPRNKCHEYTLVIRVSHTMLRTFSNFWFISDCEFTKTDYTNWSEWTECRTDNGEGHQERNRTFIYNCTEQAPVNRRQIIVNSTSQYVIEKRNCSKPGMVIGEPFSMLYK